MHLNLALPLLALLLQTPPNLESPDPALDDRLRAAAHDTALSIEALIAVGDFATVRARLEQVDSSALWLQLVSNYWNASGDRVFVRRYWPHLTRALRTAAASPPPDVALWHGTLEGVRSMARWFGETATARRADSLLQRLNITVLTEDSAGAQAQFALHRGWAGYRMLQDTAASESELVLAVMRGLIGWWADVPNRAAALEPHLPAEWRTFRVERLPFGREVLAARMRREQGSYEMHLQRQGGSPAIALRLAPALPLGARVRSVIVNDRDVPVHLEESLHDTHVVIETTLDHELSIEIDYEGGIDVHAPTTDIAIMDFRRAARGYALVVEGMGGTKHQVVLRSEAPLRQIDGARVVAQSGAHVTIEIDFPPADVRLLRQIYLRP